MPPEESPEAKFDRVKRRLQDLVLRGYPNPERKGCPGDAVLRELAERPLDEAVEGDSHWHHVTHCSECYREFLGFNNAFRERAKVHVARGGWTVAVAAIVIVAGVLIGLNHPSRFEFQFRHCLMPPDGWPPSLRDDWQRGSAPTGTNIAQPPHGTDPLACGG